MFRSLWPRRAELALFVGVFAVYEVYLRAFADPHFYFDAANYWALGGTFGRGGHFSLLSFQSTLRGYSLPLFDRALASIAAHTGSGAVTIVQITGALEGALLGTVLVPRLVRRVAPAAVVTPVRIVVLNVILFVFWRDYLGFPLSDFPAATLAVGGLLALSRRSLPGYAIAGIAFGLAWNVRQAYLVMLLAVLVVVLVRAGVRRTPMLAARAFVVVIIGIMIASFPQMLINHRHQHTWSPTVGQAKYVALGNLTQGMHAQRYETYVGHDYPSPSVLYLDPSTDRILAEEKIASFQSYSQYVQLVEDHPTGMIGGWVRRIFNGLDIRFSTPYIHDLDAHSEWFSLLDYSILFAAAARLLVPALRRQYGAAGWPEALALCMATATAVPLAVESRYFLPIYLVLYALVVFAPGTRRALAELGRRGSIALAVTYPLFLLLCVTISTSTVALIASP